MTPTGERAGRVKPGSRPRRVLVVTGDLGGGTGNHLLEMARHWNKSLWSLTVVSQKKPTVRWEDVDVIVFAKPRWYERVVLVHVRSLLFLHRHIRAQKPDVVHAFFFWPVIYGRVLKLLGRIAVLVENREDEGFSWSRYDYALLRLTSSRVDRVICVSEAVRRAVLRRESLDQRKMTVIHNGVKRLTGNASDASWARSELGLVVGEPVVGMVANYNRAVKGVSYFLEAVPLVLETVQDARFLCLGRGKLEERLRKQAVKLGVEDRVLFAGYKPDIERYYPVMDVSVLTSLSEGLSITLLESMRHGLPVVVTNVGGNPEVVVDGETGFLVPARNVRALADRIVALLQNPALRRRMGAAGRRRVEAEFAIADSAAAYLRVYEELISEREDGGVADGRRPASSLSV